jgi:hypothetical protein
VLRRQAGVRLGGGHQLGRGALSPLATPPAAHHVAAGAQHEAIDQLGLLHAAGAKRFDDDHEHLLHQLARPILVAEVAQAVEPDARRKLPCQFQLLFGRDHGRR